MYLVTDSDRMRMQASMANRMASIIDNNFGQSGEDRPSAWPQLNDRHARRFHGGDTTPTLELSNDLRTSIRIDNDVDAASVWTENEYAAAHQWGNAHIPPRPFFPMSEQGDLTEYSASEMERVAFETLERILDGK